MSATLEYASAVMFTCRGRGSHGRHGEALGNQRPAVCLVGAQLWVTHNVHSISCHQLVVLVSVPLPARHHALSADCIWVANMPSPTHQRIQNMMSCVKHIQGDSKGSGECTDTASDTDIGTST